MKELWLSFVCALIRFWDNRFKTAECSACQMLKTEVSRLSEQNSSLVDRLTGSVIQPTDFPGDADSKLEPIHRAKKSWNQIKAELEAAHRRQPENSTAKRGNDLASFESAIKELENVGN